MRNEVRAFLRNTLGRPRRRRNITEDDIRQVITQRNGNAIAALWAMTYPELRPGKFGQGDVYCLTKAITSIGVNVLNSYNNALERQGRERNATISAPRWGESVDGDRALRQHVVDGETRYYVQVKVEQREREFRLRNGVLVPLADIEPQLKDTRRYTVCIRRYGCVSILQFQMYNAERGGTFLYQVKR